MADLRDALGATGDADHSQRSLETYCGQIEDSERTADPAMVAGFAAVAICDRLHALTLRLDYLAHELAKGR